MSTPSYEEAARKRMAGDAMVRFADWIDRGVEELSAIIGTMPSGDPQNDWTGGQIGMLRDMLAGVRAEVRASADLTRRVAEHQMQERRTLRELRCIDLLGEGGWEWKGEPDGPPFTPGTWVHGDEDVRPQADPWRALAYVASDDRFKMPPYLKALAPTARAILEEREREEPATVEALDDRVAGDLPAWLHPALPVDDPAEATAAARDAVEFGVGYLVDGKRVAPQVVRAFVHRPALEAVVEEGEHGGS